MPCCSTGCLVTCLALAAVWMLGSSALLLLTWNKVVAALFTARTAKFWQAFLVVLTLSVLCLPKAMRCGGCGPCGKGGKGCPIHLKSQPGNAELPPAQN